ncbi:MAG: S8 family serine peptidase [bacterium]|nr:S8 family serine peptidase [bacterium]
MRKIMSITFLLVICPMLVNAEKTTILTPASAYKPMKFGGTKGVVDTLHPVWDAFKVGWSYKYRVEYEATQLTPAAGCSVFAICHGVSSRYTNSSKQCSVFIWDNASEAPGTVLYKARVTATSTTAQQVSYNWYSINPPIYVTGPFWVGNYEMDTLYPTSSVDTILTVAGTSGYRSKDSVNWYGENADYYHAAAVNYPSAGEISVSPTSLAFQIDSSSAKGMQLLAPTVCKVNIEDDAYWKDIVPGEVIIGYKNTVDVKKATLSQLGIAEKGITVKNKNMGDNFILVKVSGDIAEEKAFVRRMLARPNVSSAEPNGITRPFKNPNDPYFASYQWDKRSLKAPEAWEYGWGSDAISLAIVDNGSQYSLTDLSPRYGTVKGYDTWNDDSDPKPNDLTNEYHGTHCSGIAMATVNNSTGIAGYSNSRLYSVRVMEAGGGDLAALADGIQWCIDNGVKILSMSMGGTSSYAFIATKCINAWNAGCLLFAASGNNGVEPVAYPAGYNGVIAVGNIASDDVRDSQSNYGSALKFVAPGMGIASYFPDGSLNQLAGTSMACPQVAGGAALVWSANPSLTNAEVRDILINTATDLGTAGWDKYYGYGKPNLQKAVESAMSGGSPADTGMLTVYNSSSATGALYVTDITYKQSWIKSVSPKVFNVAIGSSNGVTVIVQASLPKGTYYDTLLIRSTDTDKDPLAVPVTLTVAAPAIEEMNNSEFNFKVSSNPTTRFAGISFNIPDAKNVTLKMYDASGREAKTLINDSKMSGSYNSKTDIRTLSSGIYFAVLQVGDRRISKKITLVR